MSYVKAGDVLPDDIIEMVQQYIDGEYVYIPRKESNRKAWGETTRAKEDIQCRNNNIYKQYQKGISINALSQKFFLSEKSIQRIITQAKKNNNSTFIPTDR